MKEIPLSKGFVALVDDEDYEELMKYKWRTHNGGYACRGQRIKGKYHGIFMHKAVMGAHANYSIIDHLDQNKLNNQKSNLRHCNHQQNAANRPPNKNNKLGLKGVFRARGKFRARICIEGKIIHLGWYDKKEEAAKAYDDAALKYFGEFAWLNYPK